CVDDTKTPVVAASASMVLLKNDPVDGDPLLPVDPQRFDRLLVTGPFAQRAQLGGYAGIPAGEASTPLDGLRGLAPPQLEVEHRPMQGGLQVVPETVLHPSAERLQDQGLIGRYHAGDATGATAFERLDARIDFPWDDSIQNIDAQIPQPRFAVHWHGVIVPERSGLHSFAIHAGHQTVMWIDGNWVELAGAKHWDPTGANESTPISLEADRAYEIVIHYADRGDAAKHVHLSWRQPLPPTSLLNPEQRERTAVVALFGYDSGDMREGRDNERLALSPAQQEDLTRLASAFRHVILVYQGGTVVVNELEDRIPAVLHSWYPGQEGGHALADVLFGHCEPGGRMPLTTPRHLQDLPDFEDYDLRAGRTYRYMDPSRIRYAFGHGLSYSTWDYRDLHAHIERDALHIRAVVHNTGKRPGETVAQVYLQEEGRAQAPRLELIAFRRCQLDAGATSTLHWHIPLQDLCIWDATRRAQVQRSGSCRIGIGAASDHLQAMTVIDLTGAASCPP
ncbi:MAG: glycoside hydrolase family 3 C-terminal domain-containing protein, partial [Planctomycetota bacterium]